MGSTSDKVSGNAKQAAGKAKNDKNLEAKGKLEKVRGNVKDTLQDASHKISNKIDIIEKK